MVAVRLPETKNAGCRQHGEPVLVCVLRHIDTSVPLAISPKSHGRCNLAVTFWGRLRLGLGDVDLGDNVYDFMLFGLL
jgi:hypothetical protein